jgi:hypothetical protein
VPRRNLVPLALLGVLALFTAGFAALAASAAPPTGSVTVQNAMAQTLGSPAGSTSFSLELTAVVAETGGATGSSVHLINYTPPSRMVVYQVTPRPALLGHLSQAAIDCVLVSYAAIFQGTGGWSSTGTGSAFTRTETLQEFSSRVPKPNGGACEPVPTAARGQVKERAVVRSGYLTELRTVAIVPAQKLGGGAPAVAGAQSETFDFLRINGVSSRTIGS